MSTSGTYDFGSSRNEQIIRDAYERAGVPLDLATDRHVKTALRSINFILQSWMNKRLNLFTIKQGMLSLNPGQTAYFLPDHAVDVLSATIRTSVRNLGGVAASSTGTAENAFDGNLNTSCAQIAPNGDISYSWNGVNYAISMLGVTSFTDSYYTLMPQFSYDGNTWVNAMSSAIPRTFYAKNYLMWFVIPVPVSAGYFRILETGGATLNIAELYFNTNINDRPITRISDDQYVNYANKNELGVPSLYWVDRQVQPIIYLYQTPNGTYNNLYFTYKRQIQDIGRLTDVAEIPARFFDALTSELSYRIAVKEGRLDRVAILEKDYLEAFKWAAFEDAKKVPVTINTNPSSKWSIR
jgi:hypothetical protein